MLKKQIECGAFSGPDPCQVLVANTACRPTHTLMIQQQPGNNGNKQQATQSAQAMQ
jgi:hypothetical protein